MFWFPGRAELWNLFVLCSATRPGEKFKTRKRGREDSGKPEQTAEDTTAAASAAADAGETGSHGRALRGCVGYIESKRGKSAADSGGGALNLTLKAPREASHLLK